MYSVSAPVIINGCHLRFYVVLERKEGETDGGERRERQKDKYGGKGKAEKGERERERKGGRGEETGDRD